MIHEMQIEPGRVVTARLEPEVSEAINRILRGEISAVEAYDKVLAKFPDDPESNNLRQIRNHHKELILHWESIVLERASNAAHSSGPWGTIVEAYVGTASLFGESSALKALREGEKHGINEYEDLIENNVLSRDQNRFIERQVLPQLKAHIHVLETMASRH